MITDPQILFLDEPTSGLDSFTANKIVKLLVGQARMGKTVIATIHQPGSSTFALFDRLILLMDGYQIYQGLAKDSMEYFETLGFRAPKYANPADYFLKEFYVPFKKTTKDIERLENLVSCYEKNLEEKLLQEDKEANGYDVINSRKLKKNQTHAPF